MVGQVVIEAALLRRLAPIAVLVAAVVWIGFLSLQKREVAAERDGLVKWQGSITIAIEAADPPAAGEKIDPASIPTRIATMAENGRKWKLEALRLSGEIERLKVEGEKARQAAQEARQSAQEANAGRRADADRLRSYSPAQAGPVLSQDTWSKM